MLKKVTTLAVALSLFTFSLGYGQTSVKGRVVDKDYKPVQGALAKLIIAKKSQTTNQEGRFVIDMPSHVIPVSAIPLSNMISFHNGVLSFNASANQQQINIEIFDIKGQRVHSLQQKMTGKEISHSRILPEALPVAMYFVKIRIGKNAGNFRVMNFKNKTSNMSGQEVSFEKTSVSQSANSTAVVDTLEVSKTGYQTVKQAISSYSIDLSDIQLKSDVPNDEGLPPIVNGQQAKTTRYWDCCKPHCGWHSNMKMCDINGNEISDKNAKSSCEGGPAFQCMDYAPIEVNSKVSYGWAAFNNGGTQCGDCFQLDFQGAASGKQMIVQIINIGDGGANAFDLLIPGGGVGAMNGCSRQWNNAPLGVQYGGFAATCGANADCIRGMCDKAFGNRPDLMRGCNWYLTWFNMANNPNVTYARVSCPQKIKDISKIGN
jgi:hypothetical protein